MTANQHLAQAKIGRKTGQQVYLIHCADGNR